MQVVSGQPSAWRSRDDLAKELGLSRPTIERHHLDLLAQGWEAVKIGRQWRYRRVAEADQHERSAR